MKIHGTLRANRAVSKEVAEDLSTVKSCQLVRTCRKSPARASHT